MMFIKNAVRTLILFVLIFLATYTLAVAQNIVSNGSFSAAGTGWSYFAPAIGTEAYNPETSYGGSAGTNIVGEVDVEANLTQTGIPMTVGKAYYLSFKYSRRTIGGAPATVSVEASIKNGSDVFLTEIITANNTSWNWQCASFEFVPLKDTISLAFKNLTTVASTLGILLDDITITPVEQPIVFSGSMCAGASFTLSAPSFPANPDAVYTDYIWSGPDGFTSTDPDVSFTDASDALNGTYTCSMTLNGCLNVSGIYIVDVMQEFSRIVDTICEGETYYFYGKAVTEAGIYDTVLLSETPAGCNVKATLELYVNPLPSIEISPSGEAVICEGNSLELLLLNEVSGATYSLWRDGIEVLPEVSRSTSIGEAGKYTLIGKVGQCIGSSDTLTVSLSKLPVAAITLPDYQPGCTPDTVTLEAMTVNNASYYWSPASNFHGAGIPEGQTVRGIFDAPKTLISLLVVDENGCMNRDSIQIVTESCCSISLPNSFTPNGDGLNDYFEINLLPGQKVIAFEVYDRYGKSVYSSSFEGIKWNGFYANAQPANAGVYMYIMKYTCGNGEVFTKRGDITLLR